ncbi:PREDICTED: NADH dehydrogenase [ubiquinone] 1 beta subcomplex subunit 8, mitochondrial [Vollenhovia emeryi]|uniref:NADH dehydrogenase [ubiquinone] 1 beta subcomplex subunit 8, mitochondrial n=1 Tax=Vollenhovia emeryi TaxID=411798 RepID=UPI0005F42197|nr:PREDICTED: NADH dehydrogenase [ubiquinone] 1 beta subcomplex subunit 8, mitochondrial [Vollenhovia emeryi]
MALTAKGLGGLSTQLLRSKACSYAAARCYAERPKPWNHLWRPGVYKKEDHDKIAEKYHLHPKDYQPYPNNEKFIGDYPKLPMVGPAAKDPYYPYDIPVFRKNYCEPVHDQFEVMGEDRFSYGYKYRISLYWGTAGFFATILVCATITYLLQPYPSFIPRMEKQMPQQGVVHYSFEPADS